MPNWCKCTLTIEGPGKAIEACLVSVKSDDSLFDFDRIIPYPDNFKQKDQLAEAWSTKHPEWWKTPELVKERPIDGFNQGGNEWCVANWGTKWKAVDASLRDDCEHSIEDGSTFRRVRIDFCTAWSPPRPVILQASKFHPDLRFELLYFEPMSGLDGVLSFENGEVLPQAEGGHELHDETFTEAILRQVVDYLWEDEQADYRADSRDDHIYRSLEVLVSWLDQLHKDKK